LMTCLAALNWYRFALPRPVEMYATNYPFLQLSTKNTAKWSVSMLESNKFDDHFTIELAARNSSRWWRSCNHEVIHQNY
jgi:hypothetical protein